MAVGNLLRTHEDVERVQQAAQSVFAMGGNIPVITELENLKATLLSMENNFYARIGKSEAQFQADYANAANELNIYSSKIKNIQEQIRKKYSQNDGKVISLERLMAAFEVAIQKNFEKLEGEDRERITEKARENVAGAIAAMTKGSGIQFSGQTERTSTQSREIAPIGLGRLKISFTKRKKNKSNFHISIENGMVLTPEFLKKISNYVENSLHCKLEDLHIVEQQGESSSGDQIDREAFNQEVADLLRQAGIQNADDLVQKCDIFVNRNSSVITGYFGELYAHIILSKIFGANNILKPTGNLKTIQAGQSVPIDEVLRIGLSQFGFQVKNYKITKSNTIRISNNINAVSFLEDRLCLTGPVLDILEEFFASYQYNQPFEQKERVKSLRPGEMSIGQYREQVYENFGRVFYQLRDLFSSRVGYMLKIQDCFSAMSPEFDEKKDYYNNFFIIQNRIVPASKIIEQIINALKTGALMGGGTMHYELLPTEDKGAVLQKYLNEPNHQPNLNYLARRVRINYDITIAV